MHNLTVFDILIFSGIAVLIMNVSNKDIARGLRNNNPGNIRINSGNAWQGKIPSTKNTDGSFEQFVSAEYGIRALGKLLNNYIKAGHNTIEKIVKRYAPAADNNHVENYMKFVSAKTGILPYQTLNSFNVAALIQAIIEFENGSNPYSLDFINKSLSM